MAESGFPEKGDYSFLGDLKRLGQSALRHITVQPLASHGDHFTRVLRANRVVIDPQDHRTAEEIAHALGYVETETHPGQLFNADTLYPGEPTQELSLDEIRAQLEDDSLYLGQHPPINAPYRHAFDSRPTLDTREL